MSQAAVWRNEGWKWGAGETTENIIYRKKLASGDINASALP